MNIERLHINKPTVVVLGAGASRGASFVPDLGGVLPPLDSDFFTQAQRLSKGNIQDLLSELLRHTVEFFGPNFELTMEGFLTRLEHLINVFEDYKLKGWPANNPFTKARENFLQVLAAVLDESIGHEPQCGFHQALVESLTPDDTILSFNYDWLIDYHLKKYGDRKWNPKIGYGLPVYAKGVPFWAYSDANGQARYPKKSVTLLKMHGSMNWFKSAKRLRLRRRWWHQKGDLNFEIAPPEWNKPIRSGIYLPIWRKARHRLKDIEVLAFIGYSLPESDLPAQALFMIDTLRANHGHHLSHLIIVNPDQHARRRIRRVLLSRINSKTRLITLDSCVEFSRFLGDGR